MRAMLLAFFLLLPLVATATNPFRLVSVEEASTLLGKPGVFVYDANPREVFAKGHVPGAHLVSYKDSPASTLPFRPSGDTRLLLQEPALNGES